MRDVFVTVRLGSDIRARFDPETQQITLSSDRLGEYVAVVIDLDDCEQVLTTIGVAWGAASRQIGEAAAAEPAADNLVQFPKP